MTNPYTPPQASLTEVNQLDPSPPLWNPNAAAAWSLLFSPIFGSILHMKNWQALGKTKEAAASKRWVIGCIAAMVAMIVLTFIFPESKSIDRWTTFGGFVLLIAWYAASAREQIQFVTSGYGKDYVRRGWGKPFLYVLLTFVALMAVVIVVAVVAAAFTVDVPSPPAL
jgi:hypothetical protein